MGNQVAEWMETDGEGRASYSKGSSHYLYGCLVMATNPNKGRPTIHYYTTLPLLLAIFLPFVRHLCPFSAVLLLFYRLLLHYSMVCSSYYLTFHVLFLFYFVFCCCPRILLLLFLQRIKLIIRAAVEKSKDLRECCSPSPPSYL